LATRSNEVFAGGSFHYAGDVPARQVARWDGTRWHPLGAGLAGTVSQLAATEHRLFAIGQIVSSDDPGATNIAQWDGTQWSKVGAGIDGDIRVVAATGRDVYVARLAGSPLGYIISRWDGSTWTDLPVPESGINVLSMVATSDEVIIGGRFTTIGTNVVNNIARLADGRWQSLGSGVTGNTERDLNYRPFAEVRSLWLDSSGLYAGGSFTNAGGFTAMNVARWDGARWHPLGSQLRGEGSCYLGSCFYPVTAVARAANTLYAGGEFRYGSNSIQGFVAQWDGSKWELVFEGSWFNNFDFNGIVRVLTLAGSETELYLGGRFVRIDSIPSHGFGIWHSGPRPSLRARWEDPHIVLTWPRPFQDASLEMSDSLGCDRWSLVPGVEPREVPDHPNEIEAAISPSAARGFFRLRWRPPGGR
jgi:hypothetical protein